MIAFLLILLSTAFFIPVFLEYFRTGEVSKIPTLIVCGFAVLVAVQSFFAGMMLSNIQQKNRQDMEQWLQVFESVKRRESAD